MPPKSHGRKHNAQRRQIETPATVQAGSSDPAGSSAPVAAAATIVSNVKTSNRPSSTQSVPRRIYVGRELIRVAIVTVITIGILVVLAFVLQ